MPIDTMTNQSGTDPETSDERMMGVCEWTHAPARSRGRDLVSVDVNVNQKKMYSVAKIAKLLHRP